MSWYRNRNRPEAYTAVVLDGPSHLRLVEGMRGHLPEGWETVAHHMTIHLGRAEEGDQPGRVVRLTAHEWAADSRVLAVGVHGHPTTDGRRPHVTVGVNRAGGGEPKDSNLLTGWTPLDPPIELVGTVTEVIRPVGPRD